MSNSIVQDGAVNFPVKGSKVRISAWASPVCLSGVQFKLGYCPGGVGRLVNIHSAEFPPKFVVFTVALDDGQTQEFRRPFTLDGLTGVYTECGDVI